MGMMNRVSTVEEITMGSLSIRWSVENASLGPQPPFGAKLTRLTSAEAVRRQLAQLASDGRLSEEQVAQHR